MNWPLFISCLAIAFSLASWGVTYMWHRQLNRTREMLHGSFEYNNRFLAVIMAVAQSNSRASERDKDFYSVDLEPALWATVTSIAEGAKKNGAELIKKEQESS